MFLCRSAIRSTHFLKYSDRTRALLAKLTVRRAEIYLQAQMKIAFLSRDPKTYVCGFFIFALYAYVYVCVRVWFFMLLRMLLVSYSFFL